MEIINDKTRFDSVISSLRAAFPTITEDGVFRWSNIAGILKLNIKKNWTVASSNSNYQINSGDVKDFFPVLQISDAFPHWRLEMPGIVDSEVYRQFVPAQQGTGWITSRFSYRHKIQNGFPYLQLTLEDELRPIKNSLVENDQIFFLKETGTTNYFIFPVKGQLLAGDPFVCNNPDVMNTDRTKFDLAEIIPQEDASRSKGTNTLYFGAPGTGKSFIVEEIFAGIDNEQQKERVTFHPEFDYTSFVGGYRPVSEKDEALGTEKITYKFVPQIFTDLYVRAWNDPGRDYHLAIEEINRGNCAEIFGDIFQLLDRNSDYSITPSQELGQHLMTVLMDPVNGFTGGKIKLPRNLFLHATMNTSDQSLFPMDSAFKRRWDWRYVPVNYEQLNEDGSENESYGYYVKIDSQRQFRWIDFIREVNAIIRSNRNLGMDKCIGNYFLKPMDGMEISLENFINKVIFYLWNDVFKDEDNSLFEDGVVFEDFYPVRGAGIDLLTVMLDKLSVVYLAEEE